MPALRMSDSSASATPGVLDLHRDRAAVEQRRPVHLADRGGGERLRLELGEVLVDRLAVLLLDHLRRPAPTASAAPRCAASRAPPGRSRRTPGGRNSVSMNEASWPIFIAAPFISPSVADHLQRGLQVARLELLVGALLRARDARPPWCPAYSRRLAAQRACPSFAERRTRPFGIFISSSDTGRRVAAPGDDRADEPPGLLDGLAGFRAGTTRTSGRNGSRPGRARARASTPPARRALGELMRVLALRIAGRRPGSASAAGPRVLLERVQQRVVDRVPGEVVRRPAGGPARPSSPRARSSWLVIRRVLAGDVDPRAEPHGAAGHRAAVALQLQEQRHAEARPGRVARDHDPARVDPARDHPPVGALDVLEVGREGVLGREPVLGGQRGLVGRPRPRRRSRPVAVGRAEGVAAAVEVEDASPAGSGRG